MSRARQYGIGYLGWSWSGNSGADAALDLAINFNGNDLSTWGHLLFNDANGITATAKRATIFGGSTTTPPAAPTPSAVAGNAQVALSWAAVTGAASYDVKRSTSANGPFSNIVSATAVTNHLDVSVTNGGTYFYQVVGRNSAGTATSSTVSATPTGINPGAACTLTLDTSADWGTSQRCCA